MGREMIQRTSGSAKMKTSRRGSSGDGPSIKQAVRAVEVQLRLKQGGTPTAKPRKKVRKIK